MTKKDDGFEKPSNKQGTSDGYMVKKGGRSWQSAMKGAKKSTETAEPLPPKTKKPYDITKPAKNDK